LIALGTLVLLAVAWGAMVRVQGVGLMEVFSTEWIKAYSTRWLYERHFFILYACGFVAWWVVYFGSRKQRATGEESLYKRVKTLRRLLGECSVQWGSADQITPESLDRMEAGFRNKAQSSMTTIAILVAVSALELQEVSKLLAPLLVGQTGDEFSWQVVILVLSLMFSMVAFIAYIVSADALDVIFNNFVDDDSRHRITRYYYQHTINPRYMALISLIASFILLVAYYSPLGASVAIGLFFVIGYSHWFPVFDKVRRSFLRRIVSILGKVVLVVLPILPMRCSGRFLFPS